MSEVDYRVENHVAHVILRAARVNWAMIQALTPLPNQAASDGARVLLLSAAGPDFSHGVDLVDPVLAAQMQIDGGRGVADAGQRLVDAWGEAAIPTVVALRGRAIGAGACLAVAADFRFASPDATIAFPEVARGMHLSWGIVPRIVAAFGPHWAHWLAVGGQPIRVSELGDGVARIGESPGEDALRWAAHLAKLPPLAVRHIREVIAGSSTAVRRAGNVDPARFSETIQSADFAEAMAAWFEKRTGVFKGE